MEEDDEFGDLYTDVFPSISSAPTPPPQSSPAQQPSSSTLPLSSRPIDLNLKIPDDSRITPSASDSRALAPSTASIQGADVRTVASSLWVSEPSASAELPQRSFQDAKLRSNLGAEALRQLNKGADFMETDVKFDIEEADADPDIGSLAGMICSRQSNGGDDWDSDSEDELQIVLNDNPPLGAMGMFGDGADDGDGDEDPLVVVADGDPNQATEATDWGEDAGQTGPDGERKEPGGGEAAKTIGAVAVPPKVGYSSHGFHPFHSQFKYVRPGAAPIPGANVAGPGGGQIRPPMNVVAVAGRGRGEWRPPGIRSVPPFQKNYQAGFGPPTWGSGRGFGGGGLDFTLPSHKTIFEVDIDSFEEKPWKYPGVDMTDFFNFGLNEESWKDYSKQLGQHRLQTTMQSRIRVHEGVRTEQEYDPEMPPELAAATGNHDLRTENTNVGKADAGHIDPNVPPARPPVPAGRPIQVEIASVERLPSMETRPPRFRESDAIKIVLQGSLDDNSTSGQGDEDHHDNRSLTNNVDEDDKAEKESVHEDNDNSDTYSDKNKEPFRKASGNSTPDNRDKVSPQVPHHPPAFSRSQIPVSGDGINEDNRRNQRRRAHHSRSPYESPTYSAEDKRSVDNREGSTESMVIKSGARQLSLEHNDVSSVSGDGTSEVEKKDMALDEEGPNKTPELESKLPSREEDLDDGENSSRAARSSENSKARSGSSREYQKRHGDNEEEVIQTSRSMHMTSNRSNSEVEDYRRRRSDEVERNHRLVVKGGREAASYKDVAMKGGRESSEGLDRRRERDRYDKVTSSQWRDDDPQGRGSRAEETRKRDRTDDIGSRHRSRKEVDNSLYEVHFDKDLSSRPRERDDGYPNKRKKEEHVRRDHAGKEEIIQHVNRESITHQKQEREREDSDDHYSSKHRDDIPMHRERSEKQKNRDMLSKPRQIHDEDVPKWDKEIPGSRGRGAEDKPRIAHGRSNDEYRVSDKDYQYKDTSRQTEQVKSRDRAMVDESKNYHRGRDDVRSRGMIEDKRSRPERLTSRSGRSTNFAENQKMHEREHRESTRKYKESEAGDNNLVASKRKRDDQTDRAADRGLTAADGGGEEASSDDEQRDLRRGRSKMERWTSHKERDFIINSKPSSSLKMKEVGRSSNSSNGGRKENHPKAVELDAVVEETEVDGAADVKPVDNNNNKLLDTVEKLKKRSERFKHPLPIEKEGQAVKKTDIEALPRVKNEAPSTTETESKHERPARKRRWISG